MSIRDAATISEGTEFNADVCIIGSGAAGITIARQLNGTRLSVILLEAGALERDVAVERDAFEIDQIGIPWRNPIPDRGRWFGGSTNLWYGRIALPDPIDFERRPWVRYSGWPLSLDELTPWLHEAANILDVRHFDKMNIEHWRDCPTVSTFTAEGRANVGTFFWAEGMSVGPRHHRLLEQSRNVQLLLNATATELIPDDSASAVAALAVCGTPLNRFTVRATTYVLAAGGLENPRLLLASTRGCTTGLGNAYDQVGRYYMDHPRGEGLAQVGLQNLTNSQTQRVLMLGETARTRYGKAQLRVKFSRDMQREEQLLNHALHANLSSEMHESTGYRSAKRLWQRLRGNELETERSIGEDLSASVRTAPGLVAFGARRIMGMARPTKLWLIDQMEQEPDPSSRVTVNPGQRDRFSLPRLSLDWRISEATYRSQRRMHLLVKDILGRAGITEFYSEVLDRPDERPNLWDMKHPMGTTRMAKSPREGVVDPDCRVHGVRNLYVTGSSVFPTGGHFNPTLLIVALAARLADHIAHASTFNGMVHERRAPPLSMNSAAGVRSEGSSRFG